VIAYYTMESIRDLLAGRFEIRSSQGEPVPLPSWNRCPCPIIKKCAAKGQTMCVGYVSVFVNTDKIRWLYLEISFFREKQKAFIRVESPQTQKLFELGIITDETALKKEMF